MALAESLVLRPRVTVTAQQYIDALHQNVQGFVAIGHKPTSQKWEQKLYAPEDLSMALEQCQWLDDYYVSMNLFNGRSRRIEDVSWLVCVYADLDCYKLGMSQEETLARLNLEVFGTKFPVPNFIVLSGRGIQLSWIHNPVDTGKIQCWQQVNNYLVELLAKYGADPQSSDASRVLRVPGTINSKNGHLVTAYRYHDKRYSLKELHAWIPQQEIEHRQSDKSRRTFKSSKVRDIRTPRMIHYRYIEDLITLCELRQWKMGEYYLREKTLFLYRYWTLCYLGDKREALRSALELNDRFDIPLPKHEVINATKSAEKAWEASLDPEKNRKAREMNYPGAGYNYSAKKLVKELAITSDEQKHLKRIMDYSEIIRRKRERRTRRRRELGVQDRQQYLSNRKQAKNAKPRPTSIGAKKNPQATTKELAQLLGVTEQYVRVLRKEVAKTQSDQESREKDVSKLGVQNRAEYLYKCKTVTEAHLEALREAIKMNPLAKRKELSQFLGVSVSYIARLLKILENCTQVV